MVQRLLAGIVALLALTALTAAGANAAPAQTATAQAARAQTGTARAGVVVDEGNGTVRRVGITFSGSITGIDALRSAGFAPTVRSFGGIGGAVCALDIGGTHFGCPDDATCLTCADPDYWSYSRATRGTTSFTTWRAGAGATQVHDGDIEGWRWGTGSTPTYVPLARFFPAPPPLSTTTVPAPPTSAPRTTTPGRSPTTAPLVHGEGSRPGGTGTSRPPAPSSTALSSNAHSKKSGATTSTASPSSAAGRGATTIATSAPPPSSGARAGPGVSTGRLAAAPPTVHSASGTSPTVWIMFGMIVAAFAVAIAAAHRRRARVAGD